jgi:uncharacterized phage-associated protein
VEKVSAVSDEFLRLARSDSCYEDLSHMKLQKLIYCAYGWSLAVLDERLFAEKIQVWKYGPIINSVYCRFRRFGMRRITLLPKEELLEQHNKELILQVWDNYKSWTERNLSTASHEPDAPWALAKARHDFILRDDEIKGYFLRKLYDQ